MKIESLQNSKVKEWIKLKEKKYRDLNNLFLIEGDHLL
ncbi:MAG: RNA methyltransferase, partial [Bacilli bacterium]|nr:RNA methyltransferase [Bacilli bacterium]